MILSKTDFKEFLICQKCLWLKKRKPELYIEGEMSEFLKKLIKDGYEVEEYFQRTCSDGISLKGSKEKLFEETKRLMEEKKTIFQATFETEDGLFAKVDVLKFDPKNNAWDLYEVKASSEIKKDLKHNHLKDITFQKIVLEKSGVKVGKSFIVHLNKEYIRRGDLDLEKLFVVEELSEEIENIKEETELEIQKALEMLKMEDVDLNGCGCLYRSCGQRCDCFKLFNPQVPEYSVANLFRGKKLEVLINDDIFAIEDIPEDFKTTKSQAVKIDLQKTKIPIINENNIQKTLEELKYPLYFLDYETISKPIPLLDGHKPNQQIAFQYSLHILEEDEQLKHFEFLAEDFENTTVNLVKSLKENIGEIGSVIVWSESFEKGRNKEMAELHPEYKNFMSDLNNRVFDLMLIFKKDYLHPDFKGSASIKKVLPVICPGFSYEALEVQNGTMAMDSWSKMIFENKTGKEKQTIKNNLLEYCKLDTLAMVKIFEELDNL